MTKGNKKGATEICVQLGKAYPFDMKEQAEKIWCDVVNGDDFFESDGICYPRKI